MGPTIIDYFPEIQGITVDPRLMRLSQVDTPFYLFPSMSKWEFLIPKY